MRPPNPARLRNAQWRAELAGAGIQLTDHACRRMAEMGVRPEQLRRIVVDGSSWPQRDAQGEDGAVRHWHPDTPDWAALTAADVPGLVITVVFRHASSEGRYERDGRRRR